MAKVSYPGKYADWGEHDRSYEDGKHRRYELLFAVNGGAFAIGKFALENNGKYQFLKGLTLDQVAVGMIIFTILMGVDIFVFGIRLRVDVGQPVKWDIKKLTEGTFSPWGQIVLGVVCILLIAAWGRVLFAPVN